MAQTAPLVDPFAEGKAAKADDAAPLANPFAHLVDPFATPEPTIPKKADLSIGERLKLFATEGQRKILHNAGQLAAGVVPLPEAVVPKAATPEDVENRRAGSELGFGLGARLPNSASSLLAPPAFRGQSWMNPLPGDTGIDPIQGARGLSDNPHVRALMRHVTHGAAAGATGFGLWGLLHHLFQ